MQEWVDWYLSLPRAKYFVRIDSEYIHNIANYYGFKQKINHFEAAIQLMVNNTIRSSMEDIELDSQAWVIEQQAEILYGLLHSQYIMTEKGLDKIKAKYMKGDFPKCPRVLCHGTCCLPYGVSEKLNEYSVKLYCPNCHDIFNNTDSTVSSIDGAFFGPSYVHNFSQKFPVFIRKEKAESYEPKLFGFKLCPNDIKDDDTFN